MINEEEALEFLSHVDGSKDVADLICLMKDLLDMQVKRIEVLIKRNKILESKLEERDNLLNTIFSDIRSATCRWDQLMGK